MEDQVKPGQYLTAFMDNMKHPPGINRNDRKAVLKRVNMAATRGVKFISPPMPVLDKSKPMLLSDMRPPYPVTVIEGDVLPGAAVITIARDTGTAVELNFITHTEPDTESVSGGTGGWFVSPLMCRVPYSDASAHEFYYMDVQILLKEAMKDRDLGVDTYQPFIRFYAAVCQILANHNVETQDIEPDAKENRVRRIKGRAPLYTYKTLVIGAPKARQVGGGGGTHASPRSHLRRGFYRTSPKGVRHWVNATMVKGETPGFVHKDYQIQQGAN
jgi:hypothetical protein